MLFQVSLKRSDTICTPCKRTERSDVLFSSTPNGKVYHGNDLANSPYLKALRNLNERGASLILGMMLVSPTYLFWELFDIICYVLRFYQNQNIWYGKRSFQEYGHLPDK